MRYSIFALGLVAFISSGKADCHHPSAPPDTGDISLYRGRNCVGRYLNVAAMDTCQDWPEFDACSAITRKGVTCDIYKSDGCSGDYVTTIDSSGYRQFCGLGPETIQSVRCRAA
ncbi:hypothetical protein BX616_006607 [Lobosporangium transversale]|uniref:Uncharacterized protein n=1 Tax=Lobosporangium transversale TaxID=64571 RepID=A0A1Y2GD58_9FUNG|nr:hypothetical protein BCR41DRAFT_360139 [Lobosporangium transversale]KAF9896870.1 hypothetical protein BX616_006607 [Lobosporangium transversale]ORZ07526.1 hypothetical protein BCR41DRAFT_360139 [Lobosporangium transversale]|eukprot:XP_021878033.1 hypothetical protein BCR41DRAFT_360139 [Lobosporangium transversale]